MKIKRFSGKDMREAMRKVRESFGPDAVILQTDRVDGRLEITAAMDFDPAAYRKAQVPQATPAPAAQIDCTDEEFESSPVLTEEPVAATADTASAAELARMRDEVQTIRCLLEAQLSRLVWDEKSRRNPEVAGVMRNLSQLGLTPDIVQRLVDEARPATGANTWTASLKQLVEHIAVCDQDMACEGGIYAVIGPTGVGKTTSIAKMAARYALQGRSQDIALITIDTYRIGAREQLETFGRIMNVPVYQAEDAASLSTVLRALTDKKLILIDTAGMGQRDLRLTRELACLADAEQDIKVLLALPANTQTESMQEIVDAYLTADPAACILTKIDEATSLGGAFSVLIRTGLPLAYVANGQRVPEDLHFARARQAWLAKAAVELIRRRPDSVTEDYMAEHFSEVASNACA